MPIFYIKPDGNDTLDGTSWGSAWKSIISGATAARIAPGDTIRFEKSPDPTHVDTGSWTPGPPPAVKSIVSSTDATPINIRINTHGYQTGDIVQIVGHTVNLSANGFWIITYVDDSNFTLDDSVGYGAGAGGATGTGRLSNYKCIKLDKAHTQAVCNCDTAWTTADAAKCVCTVSATTWKEGYGSANNALQAAAGVERLAYFPLASPMDLSNYEQISFWSRSSIAVNDSDLSIKLCTDATGGDGVHTINIMPMAANIWAVNLLDNDATLSSSINSIGLYQNVDKGALTLNIDNIVASKARDSSDSISLLSLMGKNDSTETWWALQSIKDKILVVDGPCGVTMCNTGYGYDGQDATTCPTYKRETTLVPISSATAGHSSGLQTTEDGNASNFFYFEGGFEKDTTNQNGETIYDCRNSTGIILPAHSYLSFNRLSATRMAYGYQTSVTSRVNIWVTCSFLNNCGRGVVAQAGFSKYNIDSVCGNSIGLNPEGNNNYYTVKNLHCNSDYAIYSATASARNPQFDIDRMYNNRLGITLLAGHSALIRNTDAQDNGTHEFRAVDNVVFQNLLTNDTLFLNTTAGIIWSERHNRIDGNQYIIHSGYTVQRQTVEYHGSAAWSMYLTATRNFLWPAWHKLLRIRVETIDKLHTVSVWIKKDHATNAQAYLYIAGYQCGNTFAETTAFKANDTDWEQVSISFTPTVIGSVEVEARGYYVAAVSHVYFDDLITLTVES